MTQCQPYDVDSVIAIVQIKSGKSPMNNVANNVNGTAELNLRPAVSSAAQMWR